MEKAKLLKALSNVKINTTLMQHFKTFLNQPQIKNRKEFEDIFVEEFKDYLKSNTFNYTLSNEFLNSQSEDAIFFKDFIEADKKAILLNEIEQPIYEASFLAASQNRILTGSPHYYRKKVQVSFVEKKGSEQAPSPFEIDLPSLGTINCITACPNGTFLYTNNAYSEKIQKIEFKNNNSVEFSTHSGYIHLREKFGEKLRVQDIASLSDNKTVVALGSHAKSGNHLSYHTMGTRITILSENGMDKLRSWKTDASTVAVTSDDLIVSGCGYVRSSYWGLGSNYWAGKISVWDQTGQLLRSWDAPTQCLVTAGKKIFSYGTVGNEDSKEGLISIWNSETGERLKCISVPKYGATSKCNDTQNSHLPALRIHGNHLFFSSNTTYEWKDLGATENLVEVKNSETVVDVFANNDAWKHLTNYINIQLKSERKGEFLDNLIKLKSHCETELNEDKRNSLFQNIKEAVQKEIGRNNGLGLWDKSIDPDLIALNHVLNPVTQQQPSLRTRIRDRE